MCYNLYNVNKPIGVNDMTKKHFNDFAIEILALVNVGRIKEADATARVVIVVAAKHNPNFNPTRFLSACGL